MLTIHADSRGHALAVRGERIEAAGPLAELSAGHPHARVRTWPGILTPGFVNLHGTELLERAYHPDPREAGLGTEPLTGDALRALALDDARWGASARRGVQRMLAHGTVAAACEPFRIRAVQDAVRRTGLTVLPPPAPPRRHPLPRPPSPRTCPPRPRRRARPARPPASPCSTCTTKQSWPNEAPRQRAWRR
ncbi:hypothetical protein LT493_35900 [Streptomyces tricolor]|nr:hypothetical protein [Streptomyces tricolor]